jgi:hypothetical protein
MKNIIGYTIIVLVILAIISGLIYAHGFTVVLLSLITAGIIMGLIYVATKLIS